ncbi:Methyltransferase-like protein 6 [Porphyridium purpureum]|uniref:tRNA N(3)-methylcytidine methyltransferase n=1 Tax=Porphyridium purpureum TaxID=35688 RepID=A0A5J4Z9N8_PORPP|nr:Methyltransferase-like protein 6 [Porphyridium purpureum]|eukprot:POR3336..scf295_1
MGDAALRSASVRASSRTGNEQPEYGVRRFWVELYEREASKNWNKFYRTHGTRAYKDRHWMQNEDTDGFAELNFNRAQCCASGSPHSSSPRVVLEVGCGVGNTALPLLASCGDGLFVHAFDFAPSAVEIFKQLPEFAQYSAQCNVFVCDVTSDSLAAHVAPKSVDIVLLFFVLSAISPSKHVRALENLASVLKPDGVVLFRDYAAGDLAELRFKRSSQLDEHFFVRQDGTRSFFFEQHRLDATCTQAGLQCRSSRIVSRSITNRKLDLHMERRWLQAVYGVEMVGSHKESLGASSNAQLFDCTD